MSHAPQSISPPPSHASNGQPFVDPNWTAPLDVAAEIAQTPEDVQVAGMFFLAIQSKAKELALTLSGARQRYVAFNFYPLRELIPLMVEGSQLFYRKPLREGLRTMGHAVPKALLASTVGKVVFGSAEGIHAAAEAMAKSYAISLRPPSQGELIRSGPHWLVVRLNGVHYFLDSHHVGIFEGVLLYAGVQGSVKIAALGGGSTELLLTW